MKTKKKKEPAPIRYVARAQIVANISGQGNAVTLPRVNASYGQHAVFSMLESEGFGRDFGEMFRRMARASRIIRLYRYNTLPAADVVATRYLRDVFGSGTSIQAVLPSCYTPNGWVSPPPQGHVCKSFVFYEPGLNFVSAGRNLALRFCVSVDVVRDFSPERRAPSTTRRKA